MHTLIVLQIFQSVLQLRQRFDPPDRLVGRHEPSLKRAPANLGGVWCGFVMDVKRPSPEVNPQLLLVSTLRMCVCGAVHKLLQYVLL